MLQSDAREAEQGEHQIAFALAAARFHRVALERVQRAESRFQAGEERLVFPDRVRADDVLCQHELALVQPGEELHKRDQSIPCQEL